MPMDKRKQRILEAVVALYSAEGEPIGSGLLASYLVDMALSSATLRNEMAAMTRLGFLEQPHTSAGRIPSVQGYRYYLDSLIADKENIRLLDTDRKQIDDCFAAMDAEPEKLAQGTARAMADLTGCSAAVTTPQAPDLCIAHFEVVQVGRYSAAVLGVTSACGVRTRVARVEGGFSRSDAYAMEQLLNASLTFVAPEDMTPVLSASLALAAGDRLAPVVRAAQALVVTTPKAYLEGLQNIARLPESRDNLCVLLDIFSDSAAARKLISPLGDGVTAQFGEDLTPAMPGLCIVSKRYLAGSGLTGAAALIGSQRMDYRRLIPILEYFSLKLGQSMAGKQQEDPS